MLDEQQAVDIYMAKLAMREQDRDDASSTNKTQGTRSKSVTVSVLYGVTDRTIRDIWNRQSWAYATSHLWHLEPQLGVGEESIMPAEKVRSYA
jgi:hypothetical protein